MHKKEDVAIIIELFRMQYECLKPDDKRPTKRPAILSIRVMITGEIPRVTEFEKGFPLQYKVKNKFELVPDPLVKDDQALVMNIKDKGLLVLTSCGHAGIINTTIKYAKKKLRVLEKYILFLADFIYQDRDMKNRFC
jgi:7,8-dihydropterin-6-yl-methyl-4-(beta-D-ribofuranosyl)aminobenzene 5'-phosphate synthase